MIDSLVIGMSIKLFMLTFMSIPEAEYKDIFYCQELDIMRYCDKAKDNICTYNKTDYSCPINFISMESFINITKIDKTGGKNKDKQDKNIVSYGSILSSDKILDKMAKYKLIGTSPTDIKTKIQKVKIRYFPFNIVIAEYYSSTYTFPISVLGKSENVI